MRSTQTSAQTVLLSRTAGADAAPTHRLARVIAVEEDGAIVTLDIEGVQHSASVSVSCLIRPLPDDLVLAFCTSERIFVLDVLERSAPNYATLALPGRGNLSVEGETIALAARQRLSLRADAADIKVRVFAVLAERATWLGKLLVTIVDRLRSSARMQETSADSLTVKAVDRVAIVDQMDSLQASTQVVNVAGVATETAQSRVIAVTDDLRIDGKRVTVA